MSDIVAIRYSSLLPPHSVAPSAPPNNLHVTDHDSSSVHLSWDPPPAEQHNGQLTGYTIKVKYQDGNKDRPSLTADNTSQVVDGLKPNTKYTFQVRAMTAAGSGPPASTENCTAEGGKIAYSD